MIATSTSQIFFIQSLSLTKIVGLDSNSNLVSIVLNLRQYANLACILVQGGIVLDCICNVKYEAFFIVARLFFDTRKKTS